MTALQESKLPIPPTTCWVVVSQYQGVMICYEWVRGRPAPKWSDYPEHFTWMRSQVAQGNRDVLDRAYYTSNRETGDALWLLFGTQAHPMWWVDPRAAIN